MATNRPITSKEWDTIDALIMSGASCRECAKTAGRSAATISRRAAKLGVSFARDQTSAATEARVVDNKAMRVSIVANMHTLLAEALVLAIAPVTKKTVLQSGKVVDVELSRPEPRDMSDYGKWIQSLVTAVEKLAKLDNDAVSETGAIDDFIADQVDNRPRK